MSTVLTLNGDVVTSNGSVVKVNISGAQSSKSYTVSGSGNTTISPDTGYTSMESVALTVPSGSATGLSSISESSATLSTGINTLTLTKTGVSTTPTVSAGYVSSATSSTATVALTASVTTKGATTYTPGASDQIISSGTYLTGTQTISGDSDLIADNIKKDVSIFGVTGTYEGSGGNLEVEEKDVIFIDYDGTIVYSYTAAEFAQLTELPANPTHEGLTAQGWNWTLSDAKTYVSTYGRHCIGQNYITDDGSTRLYVDLDAYSLNPYIKLLVKGTVTIDWGDNSPTSTLTGTTVVNTVLSTSHTYSTPGRYVISLTCSTGVNEEFRFQGDSGPSGAEIGGSYVLDADADPAVSYATLRYRSSIYRVELGERISFNGNGLSSLRNLSQLTIPSSFSNLNVQSCTSLRGIVLSSSQTSLSNYSIQHCDSLKYISIPKSITSIGSGVFGYCENLSFVAIPPNVVTYSMDGLFHTCYMVKVVGPFPTTDVYRTWCFCRNYRLTSFTYPSGVTSTGQYTFDYCYSLKSVVLPSTLTKIDEGCFRNTAGIETFTIPNTVTQLGSEAFARCGATSFTIGTGLSTISAGCFGYAKFTSITIPSNITTINRNAFAYSHLTSITIPSTVTTFETASSVGGQFHDCTSLTSVVFNNSITTIPYQCFYGCTSLTSIQFPTGCTTIGASCFRSTGFTTITIPSTVTSIGNYAFYECTSMEEIHFTSTAPPTIGGSYTFTSLPTTCVIYVPTGTLSAYTGTSNMPNKNTYTYIEE